MQSHVEEHESPTMTSLMMGIVHDLEDLVRQQLKLFQVELKSDVYRAADAGYAMAAGLLLCSIAGVILAITGAELLLWIWPEMARWVSYLIVGGLLAIGGGILLIWARSQFQRVQSLARGTTKEETS